ncbi:MAG: heavy metal translocating P-type ATPase [Bacillota bacterium]
MTKKFRVDLYRILIAAAVFLAAILIDTVGPVKLALFLIPYAIAGYDVLLRALRNIARGRVFDENFLMALATVGAFSIGEYPEGVAVMLFYQVGELFQSYAIGRSRRSIASLMDIRPDYANIEENGELVKVDPEQIGIGEIIAVKPGEKIPLDGTVVEGSTTINTSALTGESLPREAGPGDDVISGCINISALIRVKVTRGYGESTVAKILDLVENAANKKAKAESFITRFARYYTPGVVAGAALLAVIAPLFFSGSWNVWVERALIFLVVSCPCALVISVPLSFFGGIGGASKNGILIKGGNYLEALARVRTVVFDKTGTLTYGTFRVIAVHPERISEAHLLELAALADSFSDHPISRSLLEAWGGEADSSRVADVQELAGRGASARVDGLSVSVGNGKLMDSIGVAWQVCELTGTVVHVAVDGEYAGHIVISDQIKEGAAEAIASLRKLGVKKAVMLTGDSKAAAESVAGSLGIDELYAELLPADKVEKVEELLSKKPARSVLAFVGDGINDAPTLARADVGIAMGALGTDAAIEAADVVLMDDDPKKIAAAVQISSKTLSIARQNIGFALGVKGLVLLLGALGVANMWEAVFADVGVAVLAILNASRALTYRPMRKNP